MTTHLKHDRLPPRALLSSPCRCQPALGSSERSQACRLSGHRSARGCGRARRSGRPVPARRRSADRRPHTAQRTRRTAVRARVVTIAVRQLKMETIHTCRSSRHVRPLHHRRRGRMFHRMAGFGADHRLVGRGAYRSNHARATPHGAMFKSARRQRLFRAAPPIGGSDVVAVAAYTTRHARRARDTSAPLLEPTTRSDPSDSPQRWRSTRTFASSRRRGARRRG